MPAVALCRALRGCPRSRLLYVSQMPAKSVTSDATDATDATVTNTTGEVLTDLNIWDSPAISVTSVINVINVRNTDATQFTLQDYSYPFAICNICVSYLK